MLLPPNRHNGGPPMEADGSVVREGWVAIARSMRGHAIVGFGHSVDPADSERGFVYSHAEAWIDLIMECRYEPGFISNNGRKMRLDAGQLMGATSWLAYRWNWTPKQVRRYLDKLEKDGMIDRYIPIENNSEKTETDHKLGINQGPTHSQVEIKHGRSKGRLANVITVCNYSKFQVRDWPEGQVEGQVEGRLRAGYGQVEGHNLTKEQRDKETKPYCAPPTHGSDVHASLNGSHAVNGTNGANGSHVPLPGALPLEPLVAKPDAIDDAFNKFWSAFPPGRKQSKGEAASVFRKIVTGKHRDPRMRAKADVLVSAAERFALSKPDPKYTPMPTTWLNGGRWMDDLAKPAMQMPDHVLDDYDQARRLEEEAESQWRS